MQSNRCSIAILSMALAATGLFASAAVEAKQCVFNKGGYVLEVQWYRQIDMGKNFGAPEMDALAAPVQSDTLALGAGSCTKTDEVLTLAAGVVGCLEVTTFGRTAGCVDQKGYVEKDMPAVFYTLRPNGSIDFYDPATRQSSATKILSHVQCPTQSNCMGYFKLPKSSSVWIGVPSTTQYLDFWGATATVQWGGGGPIK